MIDLDLEIQPRLTFGERFLLGLLIAIMITGLATLVVW